MVMMSPSARSDAADKAVVKAIDRVSAQIERERHQRRRSLLLAVAAVVVAGSLSTVGGAVVATRVAVARARADGTAQARVNCEATNGANRATLDTLAALLDNADRRDAATLPPAVAAMAKAARDDARRIGAERLRAVDCAARFPG